MIPVLETERLRLRAPRGGDFDTYAAAWADPRTRYMGGPMGRRRAWDEFMGEAGSWPVLGFGYWALELKRRGSSIGSVGRAHRPNFPPREVGWFVFPGWEGAGYAGEAARAARAHAFGVLGWPTLVSYIHPENTRSIRLAERLGALRDDTALREDAEDLVYRHPKPGAAP